MSGLRCPSWWKTFWFMVVVVMFVTIPQIGIDAREGRITFAILSVPLVAIIVTIVYTLKIVRPIRGVNAQLKSAFRVFDAANSMGTSWQRPADAEGDGAAAGQEGAAQKGKKGGGALGSALRRENRRRRRKRRSSQTVFSSVTINNFEASAGPPNANAPPYTVPDDDARSQGSAFSASSSANSRRPRTDGEESTDGADGGATSDGNGTPYSAPPQQPQQPPASRRQVLLESRLASDKMSANFKASAGLPELYDLQSRLLRLLDRYYALLLAHEIRLKCRDLGDKRAMLTERERDVMDQLNITIEDTSTVAQTERAAEEALAATTGEALHVPRPLQQSGLLSPPLRVPFALRRRGRFAGDNAMVAFYLSRSSDSYAVGYVSTAEALGKGGLGEGKATGDALFEIARDWPEPPPLTFDPQRGVEPLQGAWFVTGGAQFSSAAGAGAGGGSRAIVGSGDAPTEPTPLNFWERRFAYGVAQIPVVMSPPTASDGVEGLLGADAGTLGGVRHCARVSASFQALGGRTCTVSMARCRLTDGAPNSPLSAESWAPILVGHVNSVLCVLDHAHIVSEPRRRFWQMPRQTAITIHGYSLEVRGAGDTVFLGAHIAERIELGA